MKEEYIKSPLNYIGGKYKLLSQILPLFPSNINTFVDLFGGGFNVGVNVEAECNVYNDICSPVVELLRYINYKNINALLLEIDRYIEQYKLSKENKEGFLQLRNDYNNGNKTPMKFYTLLCYSFNNQIRFNKNNEYNMPFGKYRSSFNLSLRQKFIDFHKKLNELSCVFLNISFEKFDFADLSNKDFVYCDPPYFNSVASYNEQKGWTEEHERLLLDKLDELNTRNIKFALSNNLKYDNQFLDKWKNKYNIHYLNGDYSNCNYHKKDKSKDIEILITNY